MRQFLTALLSAFLLAACGGGGSSIASDPNSGGSGATPPPPAPPPPAPPPSPPPSQDGPTWDPGWNVPTNVREVFYDTNRTTQENGNDLEQVLESLSPNDRVIIHAGTYTINSKLTISVVGTEAQPVSIEAAEGETVVITRDNADQNTVNVSNTSWLALKGIEITGGSIGLRINTADHIHVYDCEVHHVGDAAITANSGNTSYLFFIDNHIHHTSGFGEGFYLGANNLAHITHHTRVIGNHIHDTGTEQGDGVEIKNGSYACIVSDNLIERTNFPGILVYGTDGRAERNIIERNTIVASNEGGIQVAGDAIVRNNLVIGAADACLVSRSHQGAVPGNLTIVHNTFVNTGVCVRLGDWNAASIVYANNALYSVTSDFRRGSTGGAIVSSNVELGALGAFLDLNVAGTSRDATPAPGSDLIGAGDAAYGVADDLSGEAREGGLDAGCVDAK